MVFTEPPPPVPSTSRTSGRRSSFAICSDMHLLAADRRVGGAAAHREVVAADHDRPAVDAAAPEHEVGRLERLELAIVAVLRAAREGADLVEAVRDRAAASIRSRTVSRPASCWRLTLSGPPICRASASRRRNSSMSASQLMSRLDPRTARL